MNGPDDTTNQPPHDDGESWALPAPEPESGADLAGEPSGPIVVPEGGPSPDSASDAPAPESRPAPVSEPVPDRRRSPLATGLSAVAIGVSVVVVSAALAFVVFRSGPEKPADPQVPSLPPASATAAQPDANQPDPNQPDPNAPITSDGPHPTRGAGPTSRTSGAPGAGSAPAPDDADAADLNLGGIEDCSMGPDTWRIISGDVGCPEATDVGIRYLAARNRGLGEGEGAHVYIDDWACTSPSAARSAELGAVAVCTRADGAHVHQLP